MTEIILHHYPTSPFSEKIRLISGYKKLAWKLVIIPSIVPKPDVVTLTGGYRKTPINRCGYLLRQRFDFRPTGKHSSTTEGELLSVTTNEYILRRVDERAGTLHVHFPHVG